MRISILIIFAILCAGTCRAQWPQEKNHGYIKLGSWSQTSNTFYALSGHEIDWNRTQYIIPGLYARIGINDRWTFTGYLSAVSYSEHFENQNVTFNYHSLGDTDLSLEYALYKNEKASFLLGADITLGVPTGAMTTFNNEVISNGDQEFNQIIRLLVGGGVLGGYYKGSLGFNNRTKGFSNEYRLALEAGTGNDKFLLLTRFNLRKAFDNGNTFIGSRGGLFANNSEETTIGAEATYYFKPKWGISVGYNWLLSGQNVFAGNSTTFGLVMKY